MRRALALALLLALVGLGGSAEAAITFVGSATAASTNGGPTTVDLTTITGLAQNDIVIVGCGVGDTDDTDHDMTMTTSGYTEVADLFADDVNEAQLGVFWKIMGATPDTSAVCADPGAGNNAGQAVVAMAFRGVDQTTPMDVTPTTATGVNTNIPDPPSVDHNNPSGVWTVVVGTFAHVGGPTVTVTAPTNYTTNAADDTANDTIDVTTGMGYYTTPADPEDPGAFTPSIADSVDDSWATATIALRPAAEPEPGAATPAVNLRRSTGFGS